MTRRSRGAAMAIAVAALTATTTVTASADDAAPTYPPGLDGRVTHQTLLTTDEQACTEVSPGRQGSLAAMTAALPVDASGTPLYTLLPLTPGVGRLRVFDYSCTVSVDGQQRARPTFVSLGAEILASRHGVPTAGTASAYLLWIGTDDPVLAARYAQLGLPAHLLASATFTAAPATGGLTAVDVDVADEPLAHTISAVGPFPSGAPASSTFTVYYVSPSAGELRLTYDNLAYPSTVATYSADFSGLQPLVPLLLSPSLAVVPNGTTPVSAGSWTTTLERLG